MKGRFANRLLLPMLMLAFPSPMARAANILEAQSGAHQITFRDDDARAVRIAKTMLGRTTNPDEDLLSERLTTAWVKVSDAKAPALFVMYSCSPTGNCGLYGFEATQTGWRLILNSLAQGCSILRSSHGGRRDIAAYMHGSATEGTLKTYRWRKNRYVRVSERDVTFK